MKKKCFLNHAMQEGLLLILLSGWLLWYSLDAHHHSYIKDWAQSPSLFPVIVSGLLAVFGLIILRQGVTERAAVSARENGCPVKTLILLGMAIAYYLALSSIKLPYMAATIGSFAFAISTFEVCTTVFLAAMMLYLGVRNKGVLVITPLLSSACLSVIFRTMLRVLLP